MNPPTLCVPAGFHDDGGGDSDGHGDGNDPRGLDPFGLPNKTHKDKQKEKNTNKTLHDS